LSIGYEKLPKLEYGKENFENFMFCPFIEVNDFLNSDLRSLHRRTREKVD
jgi:hypothetical protein